MKLFRFKDKYIFHVHTWRCKHAQDIEDEAYIKQAIEDGAEQIVFTDHLPFPNNPFGYRMDDDEFPEYIDTLSKLKEKYKDQIEVNIGVEAEYLPSYYRYYEEIYQMKEIELMVIGQHFFEDDKGISIQVYEGRVARMMESEKCFQNMMQGMKTGFFNVVVHPDRSFRHEDEWNEKLKNLTKDLIRVAMDEKIVLEKNLSSQRIPNLYWPEFWEYVPEEIDVVVGSDAHYVDDMYMIQRGLEKQY